MRALLSLLFLLPLLPAAAVHAEEAALPPAKGYVVFRSTVEDDDAMRGYGRAAWPIITSYGGRFIMLSDAVAPLEGAPDTRRIAVIEFPSLEAAQSFYASAAYQEVKRMRDGAGEVEAVLVEGTAPGSVYNPLPGSGAGE